jgi:hypothetical protein
MKYGQRLTSRRERKKEKKGWNKMKYVWEMSECKKETKKQRKNEV